ncbi:alpha-L-fucosidase [Streptacidiphilus fuscans]|uniref:alpha-L-fucosidase n=1 Tax=Streptacidiphilus fuscans TaxID=2789292 RepID=A0A931AW82_9ACTN|nr:alpha-L-fucosidase [Streptacidiphilus fuscans]MBF9066614.1 alpha-L-fucosidase [Streptacidiphilus fuscans]
MTDDYTWPADPQVRARLERWQDQKFGAIIHWGPYSRLGACESWTLCQEQDPWCAAPEPWAGDPEGYREMYEQLPAGFTAPGLDPEDWARACRDAGMRYVVFTTKHHDGFAMYNTKLSSYKSTGPDCALQRDVTREVFDAFRGQGLGAGVYFSKADWHHPDYWSPDRLAPQRFADYDTAAEPDRWQRFKEFTHGQIEELLSDYGPIDLLWLDAGWVRAPREDLDMPALAARARELQPGILVVDREVHGPQEDYRTPEQQVPDQVQPYPWESCLTLGPAWYTLGPDDTFKSVGEVVHLLLRIVARGGNLLLGFGPDHTGALPRAVHDRLAGIGAWLDVNGAAVYGSRPVAPYESGRCLFTRVGSTVNAVLLLEPDEPLPAQADIPWDGPAPDAVSLLGHPGDLPFTHADGLLSVRLPDGHKAEHALVLAARTG